MARGARTEAQDATEGIWRYLEMVKLAVGRLRRFRTWLYMNYWAG